MAGEVGGDEPESGQPRSTKRPSYRMVKANVTSAFERYVTWPKKGR
jgi:hypothetical protein